MSITASKRLNYIDFAKAISIILIVCGHMLPSGCWPKTLMYAFHVPIFAFIGGLLFSAPRNMSASLKKLFGIFKRMVIPYLVWFAISVSLYWMGTDGMASIVKGSATTDAVRLIKYFFFFENATAWKDPLWFMPCYIFVMCLFLFFSLIARGNRIASGVLSLLSFGTLIILEKVGAVIKIAGVKNAFGLNNYFLMLGFLAAGHALRPVFDACARVAENPRRRPILFSAFGVFVLTAILCLMHNKVDTSAGYYTLSFYSGLYNGFVYYVSFALLLSSSLLIALMPLPRVRAMELLSRNSLFIMFTHYFFFLDESFSWLKSAAWREFMNKHGLLYWQLDMSIGFRDGIFICVFYVLLLLLVDALIKRLPRAKGVLGIFGLQ